MHVGSIAILQNLYIYVLKNGDERCSTHDTFLRSLVDGKILVKQKTSCFLLILSIHGVTSPRTILMEFLILCLHGLKALTAVENSSEQYPNTT